MNRIEYTRVRKRQKVMLWKIPDMGLVRLSFLRHFRPLRGVRLFPLVVKPIYPVDIIGKQALFEISLGTRLPQDVIKTKADQL